VIRGVTDWEAFATGAEETQRREERRMRRYARIALIKHPDKGWQDALVEHAVTLMKARFRAEAGTKTAQIAHAEVTQFEKDLRSALQHQKTPEPGDLIAATNRLAASIVTAAINAGTAAAAAHDEDPDALVKVWFSMEDEKVRPSHAAANGQSVDVGAKFTVGGHKMDRPGDMTAPIEEWINCRCVMGLVRDEDALAAAGTIDPTTTSGDAMTITLANAEIDETALPEDEKIGVGEEVPWYGVLAPEDVMSGDGRKFSEGALRTRDLPLPLSWQKVNEPGHDGSVVVGRIDAIWRKDGQMRGMGVFLSTAEADESIGLLSEGGIRGVSIDADDGTMEMFVKDGRTLDDAIAEMETGGADIGMDDIVTVFTDARICGATLCPIPAFMEAFVSLGSPPPEFLDGDAAEVERESLNADEDQELAAETAEGRKKSAEKGHALPDGSYPIENVEDLKNAIQAIGRAKDPAKAKAHIKKRARALGEVLAAARGIALVKTEDGPGWLTHPVDTDRLRDYWAYGEGAVKIGWGTPGDFNRCRTQLSKYVKEMYLSGYCANRHYDALGFWPGQHNAGSTLVASADTPPLRFVHTDDRPKPPASWFDDPNLIEPSPITVTEEGRVYGHLARWDTCHVGISGVCTVAPHSMSDYAYFRTGYVLTDDGSVPTGTLTLGKDDIGGHADKYASPAATIQHYDNTGYGVAYVSAGEDDHGIWVAGCVAPGTTTDQIIKMRASALSGDWREIGGNLELVAALHVNVQGFPIPHPSLAASGGHQISLVAAGIIPPVVEVATTNLTIEEIVTKVLDEQARRAQATITAKRMREVALKTGRDPASRIKAVAASVRG
jgi:hypothetical protein